MNEPAIQRDADGRRCASTGLRPTHARGPAMKDTGRAAGQEAIR